MPYTAKRSLGQNFLIDQNIGQKIVALLQACPGEKVVEIGPGQGALTRELKANGIQVLALEKDQHLAKELKKIWPDMSMVVTDATKFAWTRLKGKSYTGIIGNLPYNVASVLICFLVRQAPPQTRMVFTIQKEVAERIVAPAGNRTYGGLSVWVQSFARVKYEMTLSPNVFRPKPKVYSAVISLLTLPVKEQPQYPEQLDTLIRSCFQQRRKKLAKILKSRWSPVLEEYLENQGIRMDCRPEALSPYQFQGLNTLLNQENCLDKKKQLSY